MNLFLLWKLDPALDFDILVCPKALLLSLKSSILDKETLGLVLMEFFLPADFDEFLQSVVFFPPSNVLGPFKSLRALFLNVADWLNFANCCRSRSFEGSSSRRSMRLCRTCAVILSLLLVEFGAWVVTFWSEPRICPNFESIRGSLGIYFLSALLSLGWLAKVLRVLGPTSAIPGNVRLICIELFWLTESPPPALSLDPDIDALRSPCLIPLTCKVFSICLK